MVKGMDSKARPPWSHKGAFGRLLVVGGSTLFTGAPALVALAAYRAGCDLVFVAAPRRAADVVAGFDPNLITRPLRGEVISGERITEILEFAKERRINAAVIGSGCGKAPETLEALRSLVAKLELPLVLDADAIRAVAADSVILAGRPILLTPHADEFREIAGTTLEDSEEDRQTKVAEAAHRLKTTILLKGRVDVISDGKQTALNRTGTPYMTVGGTGDTLAGIAGCFLAQGARPFEAGKRAAFINGKAGEAAAKRFGAGLIASDLLLEIPTFL